MIVRLRSRWIRDTMSARVVTPNRGGGFLAYPGRDVIRPTTFPPPTSGPRSPHMRIGWVSHVGGVHR